MRPTRFRPTLLFAAWLVATGCGPATKSPTPDGGAAADAGRSGPDAVITPHVPGEPRRGPVALSFDVVDPDHDLHGFSLSFEDGSTWKPATLLFEEHTDQSASYVWDSFADAPVDGTVPMKLAAEDGAGPVALPFSIEVVNDPTDDRLVLVGHAMAAAPGGGATETGHTVSAFVWSGLGDGGAVNGGSDVATVQVGQGPTVMRASPNGRATAVLEDTDGTFSLLSTPLDPIPANVTRLGPVSLPYGSPMDLRWSADGRFLYVIGSASDDGKNPATLWRYFPSEDLSVAGEAKALAHLTGPPMALAVDGAAHRLLVFCGSGGSGSEKLLLFDAGGQKLSELDLDGSFGPPGDLEISPAGDLALMTSVMGSGVMAFSLDGGTLAQAGSMIDVANAQDVVFDPGSTTQSGSALVSQLDNDTVTPLSFTAGVAAVGTPVDGFPLSAEMDAIQRGGQAGTVLLPGVSPTSDDAFVLSTRLALDGSATPAQTALDLGPGVDEIPEGIAIQR